MSPGWKRHLGLATCLTLGLLAWELLLVTLFAEGADARVTERVVVGMAWDAAIFLPLWTVASWRALRPGRRQSVPGAAAKVSLIFLALLLPVAGARGLLRQQEAVAGVPGVQPGASISAFQEEAPGDARFLCSVAGPGAGRAPEPEGPLARGWAGMRDGVPLQVAVFPLALAFLGVQAWFRAGGFLARKTWRPVLVLTVAFLGTCVWRTGAVKQTAGSPLSDEARFAAGCAPDAPVRTYELAAISVDIPLNAHGDHIPGGLMYVREQDVPAVRAQERRSVHERVSPGLGQDPIQPLVLRANLGECLVLSFTNRLEQGPASLSIEGLGFTVLERTSLEGFVPRTAIPVGQRLTYVVPLPGSAGAQGAYLLHDGGDGARREAHGLFGALVLEPKGSVFRHPETGEPSPGTGWHALIDVPRGEGQDFREVVLLSHAMGPPEVADVRLESGQMLPELNEMAGPFRPGAFGFNYRSEPFFEREEDPARGAGPPRPFVARGLSTPMPRSYRGEAVTLHMLQAGSPEFHAYSLRSARPQREQGVPSAVLQFLRPGRGIALGHGTDAPRLPEVAGDFVFHCRMPNHSMGGMQGTWRVLETPEPGLAPLRETDGQ
ncbi:cupredoxin [Stigmatella sp. ncwal1]|uniref:Cupredoxin n=1 Tax=Stigmatella ashevillensis TaxID=2995309 RepID=A0ABT5DGN9_9BACT|nr:cupredoxin [Stigmatella ashevillena]MDC0712295.1 cupredoxin [Stigmatella ashevillena]